MKVKIRHISLLAASFSAALFTFVAPAFGCPDYIQSASKTPIHILKGHSNVVLATAFSHNGALLATAGDTTIILWDTSSWNQRLAISSVYTRSLAFSRDDKILSDSTGRLWDTTTGKPANPPTVGIVAQAVAFSPDGGLVAAWRNDGRLSILDTATFTTKHVIRHRPGAVNFVTFSHDNKVLAIGNERSVSLYQTDTGLRIQTLSGVMDRVSTGVFSPDGSLFATGGCSNFSVQIWDVRSGKLLRSLRKHSYEVLALSFSPDGKLLATGSVDATAILWNMRTGKPVSRFLDSMERIYSLSFSPDGKWLATGDAYAKTMIWPVPQR